MEELPLLELFTRLREAGVPLGMGEYQLVLRSLQAGFGVKDRESLARLCRTLWIKSVDEERIFNYHFDLLIGSNLLEKESQACQSVPSHQTSDKHFSRRWALLLISFLMISGVGYLLAVRTWQPQPKPSSTPTLNFTPTTPKLSPPLPTPSTPKPIETPTPVVVVTQNHSTTTNVLFYLGIGIAVIALSVLTVWLVRQKRQRQQQVQPVIEAVTIVSSTTLSPELIQSLGDEVRVAKVVRRRTGAGEWGFGDRSLSGSEFFPVTRRQMKQSWRYLRRLVREGTPTELDVEATVNQIGREGALLEPVLVPRRVNRTELVLLIDQDGSMVPFHSFSQRLVETAVQGGRLGRAGVYYFHNCLTDYVYRDPFHQEAVLVEDFLEQLNPSRTVILIFSDAGAARGSFNPKRRRLTKTFLDSLKQHVRYIAWLNPIPQSRWVDSTAAEIAKLVPMFEISRQGLDRAIEVLRGRYFHTDE